MNVYQQTYGAMTTLVLAGVLSPAAHSLASHVMNHMARYRVHTLAASARDLPDVVLTHPSGAYFASSSRTMLRLGQGPTDNAVSTEMILALQDLHDSRVLLNDPSDSWLESLDPTQDSRHFSRDPGIHPGKHWTEKTMLFYRLWSPEDDATRTAYWRSLMPATRREAHVY